MRELHEKPVQQETMYDVMPLHNKTKLFWRFLVMHNSWHYLRDCGQGATYGTQWSGKFSFLCGNLIKFNYIEILKNIRYCREKQFSRFQKHPKNAVHISNLKWRLNLFKRNLYNLKDINKILLKEAGY